MTAKKILYMAGFAFLILINAPVKSNSTNSNAIEIKTSIKGRLQKTVAVSLFDASPEKIWKVLTDFERHENFMPNVIESSILKNNGQQLLVKKTLKIALQKISFVISVSLDKSHTRYSWKHHEGSFKINDGTWILQREGGKTRVTYITQVEPDFYIPAWIKKMMIKKTIPRLFKAINKELLN